MKIFVIFIVSVFLVGTRVVAAAADAGTFRLDAYYQTDDTYYHGVSYKVARSYKYSRAADKRFETKVTYQTQAGPVTVTSYDEFSFECVTQSYDEFIWEANWGPLIYHCKGSANTYFFANYSSSVYSTCKLKALQYDLSPHTAGYYSTSSLQLVNQSVTTIIVSPPPQKLWTWPSLFLEFSNPYMSLPVVGPIRG